MPSSYPLAAAVAVIALAAPSIPEEQVYSENGKGASDGDEIGYSIAIEGKYLISGTPNEDFGGTDTGYVNCYKQVGSQWGWVYEDISPQGLVDGDQFGWSVDLSGKYAIVGAPGDGNQSGAAYIFIRGSNGEWTVDQKVTDDASDDNNEFGSSVAIDGKYAIVGSSQADATGIAAGRICFLIRNQDGWDFLNDSATIDGLNAGDLLGTSVAIDAKYAVVGLPGNDPGAAWAYRRTGNAWTREDIFTAIDDDVSGFGTSVAISGKYLIVGAPQTLVSGVGAGKAYVFARGSNGQWEQEDALQGVAPAGGDNFGISVSISGTTAVVGASRDNTDNGVNAGSYYVFRRTRTGEWDRVAGPVIPNDGLAEAEFGRAIAIDKKNVAVGAPYHSDSTGRTYVFR